MTGIEFNRRLESIPVYPAADSLRVRRRAGEAGLQRDPVGPDRRRCSRSAAGAARHAQPLPRPGQVRAAASGSPTAATCRPRAWPWATARARSCWRPPRRCWSPAPSSSTRGRRSRCTRTWPRSRAPARSTVPLDAEGRHDLDAMAREVTAATRLVLVCNPNNPTATALPLGEIDAFVADLPRHVAVILDEAYVEFSTLQDPDDSLDLLKRHPNLVRAAHLLQGLRALRAARRLRARLGGLPPGGGPRAPAVLGERARPGGRGRGDPPPGRGGAAAWSTRSSSACTWSPSWPTRGLETTESQANFSWVVARRPRRGRR